MTAQSFDQTTANGFAETMIEVICHGAPVLISSIGHRIALLTALADNTNAELASTATRDKHHYPSKQRPNKSKKETTLFNLTETFNATLDRTGQDKGLYAFARSPTPDRNLYYARHRTKNCAEQRKNTTNASKRRLYKLRKVKRPNYDLQNHYYIN